MENQNQKKTISISEYSRNDFDTLSFADLSKVDISADQALKTITVERIDLSFGLTQSFCQNSDYKTLKLIQGGINLEKRTAIKVLEVFCAFQSWKLLKLFFRRR